MKNGRIRPTTNQPDRPADPGPLPHLPKYPRRRRLPIIAPQGMTVTPVPPPTNQIAQQSPVPFHICPNILAEGTFPPSRLTKNGHIRHTTNQPDGPAASHPLSHLPKYSRRRPLPAVTPPRKTASSVPPPPILMAQRPPPFNVAQISSPKAPLRHPTPCRHATAVPSRGGQPPKGWRPRLKQALQVGIDYRPAQTITSGLRTRRMDPTSVLCAMYTHSPSPSPPPCHHRTDQPQPPAPYPCPPKRPTTYRTSRPLPILPV